MVKELYDPLVTVMMTDGVGMMGTVLLCETLLLLLSSMSTKDMPYHLLREYDITPIDSGVMARERRLSLSRFSRLVGGVLHNTRSVVHRVLVPLNCLPADGRRQVVRMLTLLEEIRTGDGDSLAAKCAAILIKSLLAELLSSSLVLRKGVLTSPTQLVASGCSIHSIISVDQFVGKTFNLSTLPRSSRLRSFLKTSLDLCGNSLLPALAEQLLSQLRFVPRVVVHDGSLSFSATSYHVLLKCSVSQVKAKQDVAL